MIEQAKCISEWCNENGFNFIDVDYLGIKLPCALDREYKENNDTIFIKGFFESSKKIGISYGGLKQNWTLKVPIDKIESEFIIKKFLPQNWICPRCNNKNLNLRTDDNHKTYVCPKCYTKEDNPKNQTQATLEVSS